MKIAVCLSGQPRTWRQCYDTWNFLFKDLKKNENLRETDIEVDYFVHTWDFNSKPYSVWTRERYGIEGFQAPPSDHQTSDEILPNRLNGNQRPLSHGPPALLRYSANLLSLMR